MSADFTVAIVAPAIVTNGVFRRRDHRACGLCKAAAVAGVTIEVIRQHGWDRSFARVVLHHESTAVCSLHKREAVEALAAVGIRTVVRGVT